MRIRFETELDTEAQLRDDLDETDTGRTWWIGYTWYIWAGHHWQQAIASQSRPA
jgi:hypothetical protein